jgi:DNA-binding NarL/FixJ family response regulator
LSAKILIVDDHEIVRNGIRSLLERTRPNWHVCGEGANGLEAIAAVKALTPDVLVLDITMPIMNGLQAAAEISRLKTPCRILVFTMHESERLIDEVRGVGAHGYLLKSHASRDLITAIERLLDGETFFGRSESTSGNGGGQQKGPESSSGLRATSGWQAKNGSTRSRSPRWGLGARGRLNKVMGHPRLVANLRECRYSCAPVSEMPNCRGGS